MEELTGEYHEDLNKMINANEALIAFAKWAIEQAFEGSDISGDDAQECAHGLGLLKLEQYDPNKHALAQYCEILEEGDDIYLFSELLESKGSK